MRNPDRRTLMALASLREQSHDFHMVLEWLEQCLGDADMHNRKASGEALYRSQGEAQALARIIEMAGNARRHLHNTEQDEPASPPGISPGLMR